MTNYCGKFAVSDQICLDRGGYVMALLGRRGQIMVRRRYLQGDDAHILSKWLSLHAYLESLNKKYGDK